MKKKSPKQNQKYYIAARLVTERRRIEIRQLLKELADGRISLPGALLRASCRGFVTGRVFQKKHKFKMHPGSDRLSP